MAFKRPQSLEVLSKGKGRGTFWTPGSAVRNCTTTITSISFNPTGKDAGAGNKLQPSQRIRGPRIWSSRAPQGRGPHGDPAGPRASLAPRARSEPRTEPRRTAAAEAAEKDAGLAAPWCGTPAAPGRWRRAPHCPCVSGRLLFRTSQGAPLDMPAPVRRAPDPAGQPQQRSKFIGFTYCHGGPGMDCFSKKWVGRNW